MTFSHAIFAIIFDAKQFKAFKRPIGDNGAGIGASHQTGWTALVVKLIQQVGR